jgi:hypothetical protein
VVLMRVHNRRLLIPAAVLVGLFSPAVQGATVAIAAAPQRITGIVQTVIREPVPTQNAATHGATRNSTAGDDTSTVLRVGTKIVPLDDGSLPTTKDGAKVSLAVVPGTDGAKRVVSASTISAPVAAAVPPTQQVYVAVVLPAGLAADTSITAASVQAMVGRVSSYWSSQTGGRVSFATAQVLPMYRSAYSCASTTSSTYDMWDEALRRMPAANGPGKHLVLVAPGGAERGGCPYGLGTIGAVGASGNDVFVAGLNQSLLAHELGHNLGLYHSNALRCNGTQDMPVSHLAFPGCQTNPYDDLFDVMGYSGTNYGEGNLNAVHLAGMNLLPNAVRKIPANSGVTNVRIAPLSSAADNRTLRITDPSGASYFVEYRTNSGRDSVAARNPWRPSWGVRVMRDDPNAPASAGSYELDATPTSLSTYDYNRAIPVGRTFVAASKKLAIGVMSESATGATLTISNWASPVVPSTVTLSVPMRAWAGTAITASTKVTDLHGRAVANWPVTLQRMPGGTASWRSISSVRTNPAGMASYRFANGVSGQYRWVSSAGVGATTRTSRSVAVTPTAQVFEKRPASSIRRGWYLSVNGSVSSVPAPVVYIQYRLGSGPWRTGPRATVRGTAVTGRIALKVRGNTYTRLLVRAPRFVGSVSSQRVTTVR